MLGNFSKKKGFTLIELLIVIAIIVILVTVIFVILNPLELFAEARNAQRWVNISELMTAIHIYIFKNDGEVPNETDWDEDKTYVIGTDTSGCSTTCTATTTESACLNLNDLIRDNRISSIPFDPVDGSRENTDFYIRRRNSTIITIGACDAELGEVIKHTR